MATKGDAPLWELTAAGDLTDEHLAGFGDQAFVDAIIEDRRDSKIPQSLGIQYGVGKKEEREAKDMYRL